MQLSKTVTICNLKGLHARATSAFVKTAEAFQSRITLTRADGISVSGKSIMGILMLAIPLGDRVTITADGDDAESAIQTLETLILNRFGEEN